MLTINSLIEEMYPYHNDIVIVSDRLARLVGVANDGFDFYYICSEMYPESEETWHTAVGHCESLKGKIGDQHYHSIETTFELNGAPKTDKFKVISDDSMWDREKVHNDKLLRAIFGETYEDTE